MEKEVLEEFKVKGEKVEKRKDEINGGSGEVEEKRVKWRKKGRRGGGKSGGKESKTKNKEGKEVKEIKKKSKVKNEVEIRSK